MRTPGRAYSFSMRELIDPDEDEQAVLTAPVIDRTPAEKTYVGLDLGQRRDWTALAIIDRFRKPMPVPDNPKVTRILPVYRIEMLDRIQNKSYEVISDRVAKLLWRQGLINAKLVIDETGVGAAVGDMLEARNLKPERVSITGGNTATKDGRYHRVPKRDLATTLAVVLESKRLQIPPKMPLAQVLKEEMEKFQVTISKTGHDSYGAAEDWRVNSHDDLVLAVALAIWHSETITGGQAWGFSSRFD